MQGYVIKAKNQTGDYAGYIKLATDGDAQIHFDLAQGTKLSAGEAWACLRILQDKAMFPGYHLFIARASDVPAPAPETPKVEDPKMEGREHK